MTDATAGVVKQGIRVRTMEGTQEMNVCVALQRRIWGYAPIDTVPGQTFVVAKKTGGQVMTAYDGRRSDSLWRSPLCARGLPTFAHGGGLGRVSEPRGRANAEAGPARKRARSGN
jgi:hypothetical protein